MMGIAGEAKLEYLPNDYHVVKQGTYVKCAVTGTQIPLKDLRYWSVELQEAYCNPRVSFERYIQTRSKN